MKLPRKYEFADREGLLHETEDILRRIEKVRLEGVFLSWMERLRECDISAGKYSGVPTRRNLIGIH
jgi:hypothetical protein